MDQPQIPASGHSEPDVYDHIALCWVLVPERLKVHLLLHLIHSLSLEQKEELRSCCEEDMDGWQKPWD
jgi:hypothetical protein